MGHKGHTKLTELPGCPGLVAPVGEGVGLVRPLRVGCLWFRRTWGRFVVTKGLVVRAATVEASGVVVLEVVGLSTGIAGG